MLVLVLVHDLRWHLLGRETLLGVSRSITVDGRPRELRVDGDRLLVGTFPTGVDGVAVDPEEAGDVRLRRAVQVRVRNGHLGAVHVHVLNSRRQLVHVACRVGVRVQRHMVHPGTDRAPRQRPLVVVVDEEGRDHVDLIVRHRGGFVRGVIRKDATDVQRQRQLTGQHRVVAGPVDDVRRRMGCVGGVQGRAVADEGHAAERRELLAVAVLVPELRGVRDGHRGTCRGADTGIRCDVRGRGLRSRCVVVPVRRSVVVVGPHHGNQQEQEQEHDAGSGDELHEPVLLGDTRGTHTSVVLHAPDEADEPHQCQIRRNHHEDGRADVT